MDTLKENERRSDFTDGGDNGGPPDDYVGCRNTIRLHLMLWLLAVYLVLIDFCEDTETENISGRGGPKSHIASLKNILEHTSWTLNPVEIAFSMQNVMHNRILRQSCPKSIDPIRGIFLQVQLTDPD